MAMRSFVGGAFVASVGLAAPAGFGAGQVFIVDANQGPGFDYIELDDAVAVASSGDTILLRSGDYDALTIDGKGLTIVGHPTLAGARPTVESIRIENLGPSEHLVLRGVDLYAPITIGDTLVALRHNAGSVILEDVRAAEVVGILFVTDRTAFVVDDCQRVLLTRCTAQGLPGLPSAAAQPALHPPGAGLRVTASNVFVYGGSFVGGRGASAMSTFPIGLSLSQAGAPGVDLVSGAVFLAGVHAQGGDGGDGAFVATCHAESAGGPGLHAGGGAIVLGGTFVGGAAGVPDGSCAPSGAVGGGAVLVTAGSVQAIADEPRFLEVSSPSFLGQNVTTTITGQAGELVMLFFSFAANVAYVPSLKGALAGSMPVTAFILPPLGPSGTTSFGVQLPASGLPPGLEGVNLYEQVLMAGASGNGLLSSPSVISILE